MILFIPQTTTWCPFKLPAGLGFMDEFISYTGGDEFQRKVISGEVKALRKKQSSLLNLGSNLWNLRKNQLTFFFLNSDVAALPEFSRPPCRPRVTKWGWSICLLISALCAPVPLDKVDSIQTRVPHIRCCLSAVVQVQTLAVGLSAELLQKPLIFLHPESQFCFWSESLGCMIRITKNLLWMTVKRWDTWEDRQLWTSSLWNLNSEGDKTWPLSLWLVLNTGCSRDAFPTMEPEELRGFSFTAWPGLLAWRLNHVPRRSGKLVSTAFTTALVEGWTDIFGERTAGGRAHMLAS